MDAKRKIVIIGGGFAGINFAKRINKKVYDVVLVDRNNYHSFPPLFYQIASSGLEPGSICFPFRREFSKGEGKGVEFHLGEVKKIDVTNKKIFTPYEEIPYDYLVVSAGTTNNFFGNNKLIERVYTLKSIAQAMRARDQILDRLERASICTDDERRKKLLSFTVIGGGPAGVEVAGALGEMKRYILKRNYPTISPNEVTIRLIEGAPNLLGAMSEKSQQDAYTYLKELLVDIKLSSLVKDYTDERQVILNNGESFYSDTVIWTAGVTTPAIVFEGIEVEYGPGHRLMVDDYNRLTTDSNIFAIGDIAIMPTENYPKGHPQLAQVAIQQGKLLASNLNKKKFTKKFVYNDKGTMATIGRNRAVVDINKLHLRGFIAWLAWMFVHLMSILGMRNKINVLVDWMWGYFNYGTSLRLLLYPSKFPLRWHWGEK